MSVRPIRTIAVIMHSAITLLVLMIALVFEGSKAMDGHAMTLMSVRPIRTIAVIMHSVLTLLARITAPVAQDFKAMDAHATMLMSARVGLSSVTRTQYVRTL